MLFHAQNTPVAPVQPSIEIGSFYITIFVVLLAHPNKGRGIYNDLEIIDNLVFYIFRILLYIYEC